MIFRGIVNLDLHTARQLSQYLIEKESELSFKIMDTIGHIVENAPEPIAPQLKDSPLKIGGAVLLFGKKIRTLATNSEFKTPKGMSQVIASQINQQCWSYLEILENCITELFIQMKMLDVTKWNEDMLEAAYSIKMTLMHHLEDLEWTLKRLNAQIGQLKSAEGFPSFFNTLKNLFPFISSNIDSSLIKNLKKSRKYLSFNYLKFHDNFISYQTLNKKVKKNLLRFIDYQALNNLDSESKEAFTRLYELLKMWEINQKSKVIPSGDLSNPLRNLNDPKRVSHIFEEYHYELLKEIYVRSRFLKSNSEDILTDDSVRCEVGDSLFSTLKEIHVLAATTRNYRDFLLKTDPNPYIRCRFGFGEWTVGKEPPLTKNMLLLNYEIEETNKYAEQLIHSVKTTTSLNDKSQYEQTLQKVKQLLHEMSQPLIGETTMRSLAEKILEELKSVNELETFNMEVVDFVGLTLSKILKADWKYHVLFDMKDFEKIYSIHVGIVKGDHEDRVHLNRLNEFRILCKEVKDLVKTKSFYKGLQEIELNLNDIKSSLQDFLGSVQRVIQDKSTTGEMIKDIQFQLLEYRYFFGTYFHELGALGSDKQLIRNKFLFVDQYLDVVDSLLETYNT